MLAFGIVHITDLTSKVIRVDISLLKTVEEDAHDVFFVFAVLKAVFGFGTVGIDTGLERIHTGIIRDGIGIRVVFGMSECSSLYPPDQFHLSFGKCHILRVECVVYHESFGFDILFGL